MGTSSGGVLRKGCAEDTDDAVLLDNCPCKPWDTGLQPSEAGFEDGNGVAGMVVRRRLVAESDLRINA